MSGGRGGESIGTLIIQVVGVGVGGEAGFRASPGPVADSGGGVHDARPSAPLSLSERVSAA